MHPFVSQLSSHSSIMRLISLGLLFFSPINEILADNTFLQRRDVQSFIQQMVKKNHFTKASLTKLCSQVKLRPQVIAHIAEPLEKKPWYTYQLLLVNDWRIKHGVLFWNKYASALAKAEKKFGVPASIIVATIGIETKYGTQTGNFRVIDSLCSLAFSESSRAFFFRKELEQFLLLTREQHLNPAKIMGSYAGAIGQPQFIPSSYRAYAINFSNSGHIDLIHNEIDVIGSVANYYQKHGWNSKEPIAEPALIIGHRYDYLSKKNKIPTTLTIAQLSEYGIVPKNKIQQDGRYVSVIKLDSRYSKEYWLGFHNFDVIKRYNASDLYAMAVFQLSFYIKTLREQGH